MEREPSAVWNNLATLSGNLGFTSLLPLIRLAFEEDLCDPWFDSLEGIEERLEAGGVSPGAEAWTPIDDVVSIMEHWACFNIPPARPRLEPRADDLTQIFHEDLHKEAFPPRPVVPPPPRYPGVTRNDPCPCGSDKKFKKCCGAG